MKFPGSKLLHQWDLATQTVSLEELFQSCQKAGLTGLAEVNLPASVALIFYYLGGEVNALYREGPVAHSGIEALERLRSMRLGDAGTVSIYELPLDMAHLLRGITNRKKLQETLRSGSDLQELLRRLERSEHTGTLEVQTASGAAMVLLVRGRASNTYWEAGDGLTYEKGEAREKLDEALGRGEATVFLSDFSRDVWKFRHGIQAPVTSRLQRREEGAEATDVLASEEAALRQQVLDELAAQIPALLQALIFDLMTGTVFVRTGRGAADIRVGPLAELIPALIRQVREQVEQSDSETVEQLELSTERISVIVAVVPEAQEGIAILADRAQPVALLEAALGRAVRGYAARLPSRQPTPVQEARPPSPRPR
jgi:hypothetical protein